MMASFLSVFVICAMQGALGADYFDDIEWKLKREKQGVQVYTGEILGSNQKAVFSTLQLQTSVKSVVALLLDLPNCKKWVHICREAKLIEKLNETEAIVYSLNDLPFPVRDRDSYSRVRWHVDRISGVVTMDSSALNSAQYGLRKGVVRIEHARARWRFVPIDDNKLIVENFVHVDPNGKLPAWFSNIFIVDTPYKALHRMRLILASGEYDNVEVPFLPFN